MPQITLVNASDLPVTDDPNADFEIGLEFLKALADEALKETKVDLSPSLAIADRKLVAHFSRVRSFVSAASLASPRCSSRLGGIPPDRESDSSPPDPDLAPSLPTPAHHPFGGTVPGSV